MKEKAVVFGKASNLIGIITEPDVRDRATDVPAVLLLNSGLLHRVGAHRLHVKLARVLAAQGVTSLRFDFSGLGDSDVRKDPLPFEQSGPLEVQEAMDFLGTKTAANGFVVAGLCSGADAAFFAACADPRVRGLAQLDGFVYRTWQYYPRRFGPKLFNPASVKGFISENIGGLFRRGLQASGEDGDFVQSPYVRVFPPQETVAAGLQTLVGRGVRMFNFFSQEHYGYRSQYEQCFRSVDFKGLLQVEFLSAADHTVSDITHQQFVVTAIADWFRRGWMSRDAAAAGRPALAASA